MVHGRSQLVERFVWLFVLNKQDLSLLSSVKYDSSLIISQRDIVFLKYAFSASWQVI